MQTRQELADTWQEMAQKTTDALDAAAAETQAGFDQVEEQLKQSRKDLDVRCTVVAATYTGTPGLQAVLEIDACWSVFMSASYCLPHASKYHAECNQHAMKSPAAGSKPHSVSIGGRAQCAFAHVGRSNTKSALRILQVRPRHQQSAQGVLLF